jgi:hypothetical protein
MSTRAHHQNLALNGQVTGTWSAHPANPDIGPIQTLTGSGTVRPLGHVQAHATLHLTGFIASGHATGTLTLASRRGSVTLALVGATQPGFSGAPTTWSYTIVQGSGRWVRAAGHGTMTLKETPEQVPNCPPGMACPQYIVPASFTLTLHSSR